MLLLIALLFGATAAQEYSHNQFRNYTCMAQSGFNTTVCTLKFDGNDDEWDSLNDNGCFMEMDIKRKEVLEFCPLQCNSAATAYIENKAPAGNNKCLAFFNYNVVQRRNDWFLWRGGDCLQEEIQFRLGCTFNFKRGTRQEIVRRHLRL